MSQNSFWKFLKGIVLQPETSDPSTTDSGAMWYNSTTGKLKSYVNGASREVVTNTDAQTLTAKTIDADTNTITNIENADIKAAAAIAQNKMAALTANRAPVTDASGFVTASAVTDTELGYLSGVTSPIQTQLNDTGTDLNDHITDASDAHDASAISFTPAGTIASTDVQGAIAEASGDLTTHESDTSTHGVAGAIVGTTDTQALTNKDIDGGTASNTNRITLPKETTTNLDALTDKEGTIAYDTTLDKVVYNDGAAWAPIDGGGGGTTFSDATFRIYDDVDNTKELRFQASSITAATQRTWTVPDANGSVVLDGASQLLSNKTIDNTNAVTLTDSNFTLQDSGDATKQIKFDAALVATGQTRTYALPDVSSTLVTTALAQTLSDKTLNNTTTITVKDANFTIQDDADTTKQAVFQASGITTATTRTYTLPNKNGTLILDSDHVVMRATLTTSQTGITDKVIPFNIATIDTHTALNTGTGVWTCPTGQAGNYRVSARILISSLDGATNAVLLIRKNSTEYGRLYLSQATSTVGSGAGDMTDIVALTDTDTVDIYIDGDASFDIDNTSGRTVFTIEKIN